jgi:hypothetical protein
LIGVGRQLFRLRQARAQDDVHLEDEPTDAGRDFDWLFGMRREQADLVGRCSCDRWVHAASLLQIFSDKQSITD